MNEKNFRKELEEIINKNSMENGSDTPDFMLADYLMECFYAFNDIIRRREKWYGRVPKTCEPPEIPIPPP